jgi:hypothetical protein
MPEEHQRYFQVVLDLLLFLICNQAKQHGESLQLTKKDQVLAQGAMKR